MDDPIEVLGVATDAGEEEIRRRYLELVRQFPPDRDPERFARIRHAYDQLRDPVARLQQKLFSVRSNETLDPVIRDVKSRLRSARIPTQTLLSLAGQG